MLTTIKIKRRQKQTSIDPFWTYDYKVTIILWARITAIRYISYPTRHAQHATLFNLFLVVPHRKPVPHFFHVNKNS